MSTHLIKAARRSYLISATSSSSSSSSCTGSVGGVTAARRFRHEPISIRHRTFAPLVTPTTRTFTSTQRNMVKPTEEVIQDFNDTVNMTADELEEWLKSGQSESAGWTGGQGGETVGHESGRKIVDILRRNPNKDPEQYTEEDLEHMRKVVSYNKRHLAQEDKMKQTKSPEELENTKSTQSLRNWGNDPIKDM